MCFSAHKPQYVQSINNLLDLSFYICQVIKFFAQCLFTDADKKNSSLENQETEKLPD